MNCNQCEQTPEGGCTTVGVCGKEPDLNGLQELVIYGLKGISAYATHARDMGYRDPDVDGFVHEALYSTLTNVNFSMDDHVDLAMRAGDAAVDVMELLDEAHTQELGVPEPTTVSQNDVEGKSILVTGHDLYGLKQLLEQVEADDEEINVYTHSEMLPAHGYPELAKFDSLKGNVGGAWHDQRVLFADFPGAIVGTTNCVQPPQEEYRDRFFTTGLAGLEDVESVERDENGWLESFTFTDGTVREYRGGFPMYGSNYNTDLAEQLGCDLTDDGTIDVDDHGRTSVDGVYAVGDVTPGHNQIPVAIGQGAKAGIDIHMDLRAFPRSLDEIAERGPVDENEVPAVSPDLLATAVAHHGHAAGPRGETGSATGDD